MNIKTSKKPDKQRKKRANYPLHKRQKQIAAPLKPKLREEHGKRRAPIREGDKVKVKRGDHKGRTGEVKNVNLKKYKITIEDIEKETKAGERINIQFSPSNLMITNLNLEDEKRKKKIEGE